MRLLERVQWHLLHKWSTWALQERWFNCWSRCGRGRLKFITHNARRRLRFIFNTAECILHTLKPFRHKRFLLVFIWIQTIIAALDLWFALTNPPIYELQFNLATQDIQFYVFTFWLISCPSSSVFMLWNSSVNYPPVESQQFPRQKNVSHIWSNGHFVLELEGLWPLENAETIPLHFTLVLEGLTYHGSLNGE